MSRLDKKIITIPEGIKVEFKDGTITVQGSKGKLTQEITPEIELEIKDNQIKVKGDLKVKRVKAQIGLFFALINNMITGVKEGYTKELEIVGIGYRAQLKGKQLELQVGLSHPVLFDIPENIKIQAPKPTQIMVEGIDKAHVGNTAASIRAICPPEPYKGKGIRYKDEYVRKKIGKAITK